MRLVEITNNKYLNYYHHNFFKSSFFLILITKSPTKNSLITITTTSKDQQITNFLGTNHQQKTAQSPKILGPLNRLSLISLHGFPPSIPPLGGLIEGIWMNYRGIVCECFMILDCLEKCNKIWPKFHNYFIAHVFWAIDTL